MNPSCAACGRTEPWVAPSLKGCRPAAQKSKQAGRSQAMGAQGANLGTPGRAQDKVGGDGQKVCTELSIVSGTREVVCDSKRKQLGRIVL